MLTRMMVLRHPISGASLMRRGIQALMQDVQSGKFDLVHRVAGPHFRDQEDIAGVYVLASSNASTSGC
jgi:hypothetical protein